MNCPDCNAPMILVSEGDRTTTYQCISCKRLIVVKKD